MNRVTSHLITFSTLKPIWVYALLLLFTLAIGSQIPRIQVDTDPENMLSESHPDRMFHNQTKQQFQVYDAIVVGMVNDQTDNGIYTPPALNDLYTLTRSISSIEGVISADMMSVSTVDNITQEGAGALRFERMMPGPVSTQAEAGDIQAHIERLPLLYDTVVSQTGKAAAIYVPIKDKNESYRVWL